MIFVTVQPMGCCGSTLICVDPIGVQGVIGVGRAGTGVPAIEGGVLVPARQGHGRNMSKT